MNEAAPTPAAPATHPRQVARRRLARLVGVAALAGTIVPAAAFMAGTLDHLLMQRVMLGAAVAWFAAAPFWMDVE
jgi:hypothetical protein